MATARELLEQAGALMRRNRARDPAAANDIPVLTEIVTPGPDDATPGSDQVPGAVSSGAQPTGEGAETASGTVSGNGAERSAAAEFPVLTEIVEDFEPISIIGEPAAADEASQWPDFDDEEIVVIDDGPAQGNAAPAPVAEEASAEVAGTDVPAHEPATAAAPVAAAVTAVAVEGGEGTPATASPAPVAPPDDGDLEAARWNALAEEVRMQVLQRIDIFTDTGLQEQLTARLQPIVDRASADLVAAINQHVGQLLRGYVAEAIEREIEKWRQGGA